MNTEHCAVIGGHLIDYDIHKIQSFCDTIVSGNAHSQHKFAYSVVNSENKLQDMLNSSIFKDTMILAPEKLYKKYIFFEQVDNLPSLPDIQVINRPIESLSEQCLALMLAMWMDKKNIYLFGYDIFDPNERSILLDLLNHNSFNQFFYVRKTNPQKIGMFDAYDNVTVLDYKQFERIRNAKK